MEWNRIRTTFVWSADFFFLDKICQSNSMWKRMSFQQIVIRLLRKYKLNLYFMDVSIEAKTRNIFGENIRKYFHDLEVDKFR